MYAQSSCEGTLAFGTTYCFWFCEALIFDVSYSPLTQFVPLYFYMIENNIKGEFIKLYKAKIKFDNIIIPYAF